jgi:hypothetical protein
MKNGQEFERLIHSIYEKITAGASIKRNDKIFGHDSKQNREIDLSIRSSVGIHTILIIVQAKDHSKPVDVNIIGEFQAVIKDTRANKGILISSKGFTKGAKELAKNYAIELLTAHDTQNPKWKLNLDIPVVITTFEGKYDLTMEFTITDEYVEKITKPDRKLPMPEKYGFTPDKGKTIVVPHDDFRERYLKNQLTTNGASQHIEYPNMDLIVEDGLYIPAREIKFNYTLAKKSFLKYFSLNEFQGLVDKLTDKITPTHYKIESDEITIENNNVQMLKSIQLDKWKMVNNIELTDQSFKINLFHFPQMKADGKFELNKL